MTTLREKIANQYMIQCQNSKDFECPYLETCPHEDKDICQWQLDKAESIIALLREEIEKKRKANPYKTGTIDAREAFDEACQSILSLLEVKEG